jgi:hypothetical protein
MSLTTYPSHENTANKITAFYPSCERTPCAVRLVSLLDQHTVAGVGVCLLLFSFSPPHNRRNVQSERRKRDSEFDSASFFQLLDMVGIGKANPQSTVITTHVCGVRGFRVPVSGCEHATRMQSECHNGGRPVDASTMSLLSGMCYYVGMEQIRGRSRYLRGRNRDVN